MSPQAWEEHYQKNKNNFCKEADPLLIAEMSLLGKKFSPHFSSILDFGCGFGANSLFLAEQGWQVTAIDLSKTAIERLQEQAKQNNLPLTAQQADAVRFSSKEKFDLVLICDLHLASKQRKKMLQNSLKFLNKKGVLLYFSLIEPTNLEWKKNEGKIFCQVKTSPQSKVDLLLCKNYFYFFDSVLPKPEGS